MRRPGWRKERGTQQGARRSTPPVAEISASTNLATFFLTVFRAVNESMFQNFVQHIDAPNTGKPFPNDWGDGWKADCPRLLSLCSAP